MDLGALACERSLMYAVWWTRSQGIAGRFAPLPRFLSNSSRRAWSVEATAAIVAEVPTECNSETSLRANGVERERFVDTLLSGWRSRLVGKVGAAATQRVVGRAARSSNGAASDTLARNAYW